MNTLIDSQDDGMARELPWIDQLKKEDIVQRVDYNTGKNGMTKTNNNDIKGLSLLSKKQGDDPGGSDMVGVCALEQSAGGLEEGLDAALHATLEQGL